MKKILFLLMLSFSLKAQENVNGFIKNTSVFSDSIKIAKIIEFLKNKNNFNYDIDFISASTNIDSVIKVKKGVCIHYSIYFKYLCDKLKIKNNIITALTPSYVDKKYNSNYCESIGLKKGEYDKIYAYLYEKYFHVKYPNNKSDKYTIYKLHAYSHVYLNNKIYIVDFATNFITFGTKFFTAEQYYRNVLPINEYVSENDVIKTLNNLNIKTFGSISNFKIDNKIHLPNEIYFSGDEIDTALQITNNKISLQEFFNKTKFY